MTDLARVKRNVSRMIEMGAPEDEIDAYVASENTTPDELRRAGSPGYMAARADQERRQSTEPVRIGGITLPGDRRGALGGFTDQVLNNLGVGDELEGAGAATAQAGRNFINTLRGRPNTISPGDAYQAAADVRSGLARRYAQERPGLNALATAAGIATSARPSTGGAMPVTSPFKPQYWKQAIPMQSVVAQPMSALKAGGTTAALTAPFAVAQQDGDIGQRVEAAAPQIATAGLLGSGLQAFVNRLAQPTAKAATPANNATLFERVGVRPTYAAVTGSETGGMAKGIAENWLLGGSARRNLQNSLDDTQQAAAALAGRFGQVRGPQIAGDEVAQGVTNFAKNRADPRSFAARSGAMYDRAFGMIDNANLAGVSTGATGQALQDIQSRVAAPNLAQLVNDPQLSRIATALRDDQGAIRFADLRALRSWVREARGNPQLRQGMDEASLARLESALTQDIMTSARQIGGAAAERTLRRADQFYRTGTQRLKQVDQRFGVMNDRVSSENLFAKIKGVATSGARADAESLLALKRSVPRDVWGDVAATLIDDMGKPTAAALGGDGAFSVTQFAKNYGASGQKGGLSEAAKDVLFGPKGSELRNALDDLAEVARLQGGVERAANASRSGVSAQNVGTLTGAGVIAAQAAAGNVLPAVGAAGGAAGVMITGEMLTNPAFVRWLAGAPRAGQTIGGWRAHLAQLGQLAARDPALSTYYSQQASALLSSPDRQQYRQQSSR